MSCLFTMPTNVLAPRIGIGIGVIVTTLGSLLAHVAHAADDPPRGHAVVAAADGGQTAFVIPPPPALAAPRLAIEVHTGLTLPLGNEGLCPKGYGCVLQSGGGVGVSLERRRPSGLGLVAAYDAWFLDSDSVYELAVQQQLRFGMRFTQPTEFVFHPIFELTCGPMVFGDIFRAATFGVVFQGFSGVEAELTESFGVRLGFGVRGFSHTAFRTERDGVRRAAHDHFSEAFFFEVGLTYM
ncbi:MAG TPA: hypothetical protein VI299_06185 [Polyangiales bacterium]